MFSKYCCVFPLPNMIVLFMFFCLLCCVDTLLFPVLTPKNSDTYGPYEFFCKTRNCQTNGPMAGQLNMTQNGPVMHFGVTFPTTLRIDQMRVAFYNVKNNHKTLILDQKLDKPCQHETVGGAFRAYMKANRDCIMKKGSYSCGLMIEEITRKFYGPAFFYGEYISKVSVHSKKQTVLCGEFHINFSKK